MIGFVLLVYCSVFWMSGYARDAWYQNVSALAVDYYRARHAKSVTVFSCWAVEERYDFFSRTTNAGMMVDFMEPTSEAVARLQPNRMSQGGLLIDVSSCATLMSELWQMDHELNKLLLGNLHWMILERNVSLERENTSESEIVDGLPPRLELLYNVRFRTLEMMPYTSVVLAFPKATGKWEVWELFKPYRKAVLSKENITSNYTPTVNGHETLSRQLMARRNIEVRRRNLQGYSMPCGAAITAPEYFKGMDDRSDVHDVFAKVNFPYIEELMHDLNFTLNMVQVDKGGYKHNGTFSGLMGKFQNHSVELGCIGTLMRTERLEVVDFMIVTLIIRSSIIFRQPPLSIVANIFELPFSVGVWACCFGLMAIYWIAMLMIRYLANGERFTPIESLVFIFGTMCQRGFEMMPPHFNGTRLLMFSLQLTSFFIITSYSASIVALLQSPSRAITSVGDLVRSPLKAGVMDSSYGRVYYQESQDPDVQDLYRKKIKSHGEKGFMEPNEGIARVRQEMFAFEAEVNAAYKIIKDTFEPEEVCKLQELEAIKLAPFGIPIVKGSKYRELIRQRLMRQREVGIIRRFNIIWIHQKPQCENQNSGYSSVGLVEMRFLYFFLAVGFLIAVMTLGGERAWWREGAKKLKSRPAIIKRKS
ncbi:ionotropic receptor 75a-like [Anopheles maculipalpis]|uniref:ionotropic receptor 75a-like n=1 Tax=Anopheles maculipalpis TaxID=1496333 RepID=UPI0021591BAB|nr:ionotropic receptor 75a-like [Anopheles maculipalpis]